MSESLATLYAATYEALKAEYPRMDPDARSTLAAQLCKAGIPYRDATGRIAFNEGARAVAPRLVAAPTLAANATDREKVRAAREWEARASDFPPAPVAPPAPAPTAAPYVAPVTVSGGHSAKAVVDAEVVAMKANIAALRSKISGQR